MSDVIATTYVWVDGAVGEILEFYDERATVIIVSDHGMRGVNRTRDFVGREGLRSGAHSNGLPGVIIVSGGHARRGEPFDLSGRGERQTRSATLPVLGGVLDIAPTVLALQGIPVGRDMDGAVLEDVLEAGFLERYPLSFVDTHDTDEWLANRPNQLLSEEVESERLRQLRSLGYIR